VSAEPSVYETYPFVREHVRLPLYKDFELNYPNAYDMYGNEWVGVPQYEQPLNLCNSFLPYDISSHSVNIQFTAVSDAARRHMLGVGSVVRLYCLDRLVDRLVIKFENSAITGPFDWCRSASATIGHLRVHLNDPEPNTLTFEFRASTKHKGTVSSSLGYGHYEIAYPEGLCPVVPEPSSTYSVHRA